MFLAICSEHDQTLLYHQCMRKHQIKWIWTTKNSSSYCFIISRDGPNIRYSAILLNNQSDQISNTWLDWIWNYSAWWKFGWAEYQSVQPNQNVFEKKPKHFFLTFHNFYFQLSIYKCFEIIRNKICTNKRLF